MKKIKVSELPLWNDIKGLFVMGVNSLNQSVKVSLEFIKEHTDAAVARADKATSDAQAATAAANKSKTDCDAAVAANNTATNAAVKRATDAASAADTASANAVKAKNDAVTATNNANTATANANAATSKANTAATNADAATAKAKTATENADRATSDAQAATERADEAKDNVLATIARVIPTALVVAAPESLTLGSAAALPRIAAQLQPEGVMQNLIFIGDNKAVAVDAQGNLRVLAEGVSLVHVIPTCNTALAKSVLIHVHAPYVRLSARNTLRLTSSGAFRFN